MRGHRLEKTGGVAYYTAHPKRCLTRPSRRLPRQTLLPTDALLPEGLR
jgi:hypothetical protein